MFFNQLGFSQITKRVEIQGIVSSSRADASGVTVYNTTSKKGAITNKNGEFVIKVSEQDQIEVSSILFKDFKFSITKAEIEAKYVQIYVLERINNLDEVVLLKYDLNGLLETDIADVVVFNTSVDFNSINLDLSKYDFSEDYKSAPSNIIVRQGEFYNLADLREIIKLMDKLLSKKNKKISDNNLRNSTSTLSLQEVYPPEFYIINYDIKPEKVQAFILYLETNDFNNTLLLPKNEMKLLEFLTQKSIAFSALN
jgi:hypothetical protein